ncbi:MAG: hypothetical protein ACP5GW_05045, partial [Caldisericaceae bacterium]
MKKKILILIVVIFLAAILTSIFFYRFYGISGNEKDEIKNVVEDFGTKLKTVNLNNPKEIASAKIRDEYYGFLTPGLLIEWMDDPGKALGSATSTPWPEKIEVISIKKLDFFEFYSSTVEVKGYIDWFASPGKEPFKREPIVLILKRYLQPIESGNPKYTFLIDNVWHGDYAFYDRNALLKIVRKAFPHDKELEYYGLPYIEKSFQISNGSAEVVFINLSKGYSSEGVTGGEFFSDQVTVGLIKGKNLQIAKFKDQYGNVGPSTFLVNTSIKDSRVFTEISQNNVSKQGIAYVDPGNIFYYSTEFDNDGTLQDVITYGYIWDGNEFVYNKTDSIDIKSAILTELKNLKPPEAKTLTNLKFKEIKGDSPYISTVAVSGNEVAFASGKGMNAINTLNIFNTATNMMTLKLSIDTHTDFAEIGDIEFNANWVLVKVFIDSSHTKAECFAIDRKANKPILLIPYDFEDKHAVVSKIALIGDKAYVAVNFYKKEDEFLLSSNFIDSKIIV